MITHGEHANAKEISLQCGIYFREKCLVRELVRRNCFYHRHKGRGNGRGGFNPGALVPSAVWFLGPIRSDARRMEFGTGIPRAVAESSAGLRKLSQVGWTSCLKPPSKPHAMPEKSLTL